jgi:hypothetical protein
MRWRFVKGHQHRQFYDRGQHQRRDRRRRDDSGHPGSGDANRTG